MEKIGFNLKDEFLPSFDKFHCLTNQRLLFLELFNQEVGCEMKFTKEEINEYKNETLFNIFVKKILKNLAFDFYVKSPLVNIDIKKTNKINWFLKKLNEKKDFKVSNTYFKLSLYESNIELALKLIDILKKSDLSFYLDGNKSFKNFVSNKMLRGKQRKNIKIYQDCIDIKSEEHYFNTKIFTFWQFLDVKDLKINSHIQKAVKCIETTEFKQVYLVYPKNENFDKHIKINCDNQIKCKEYNIKLIPFSLRSTLR